LAADARWRTRVLEKPEIWGLESISAEALIIRLVVKTRSNAKDDVARELRLRLKRALDALGVKLPALNSVVLSGFESANSVRAARPTRASTGRDNAPTPREPAARRVPRRPRDSDG
jgi:moderate conductance mechanosensitive channel